MVDGEEAARLRAEHAAVEGRGGHVRFLSEENRVEIAPVAGCPLCAAAWLERATAVPEDAAVAYEAAVAQLIAEPGSRTRAQAMRCGLALDAAREVASTSRFLWRSYQRAA